MRTFSTLTFSAMFLVTSSVTAGGERTSIYIVQQGDSLSEIADRVKGGHTYGKGENLEKILNLNPELHLHQKLPVGLQVIIPVNDLRKVASDPKVESAVIPTAPTTTVAVATATITTANPPSSSPTPEPAPLLKASPADEEDVEHRFDLKVGYQFTTINANDKITLSKAELNSEHDITAALSWSQKWTEVFKSFFSFSGRQLEFQPSTNVLKKITDANKTLLGMEVGGSFLMDSDLALQVSAKYGSELFLHGISTTNIAIDTANVSAFSLGLDYKILKKGSTTLGLAVSGSYLGGSSTDTYTIDSGSSYKGVVFIRREKNGKYLSLEVGAQQRVQNTSVSDLTETNIFGNFIYGFDLFGKESPQ